MIQSEIKDLLKNKGYADEMIVERLKTKSGMYFELCVVEPKTNKLNKNKEAAYRRSASALLGQSELDENTKIYFCIASISVNGDYESIKDYLIDRDTISFIEVQLNEAVLSYKDFKLSRELSYKNEQKENRKNILNAVNTFTKICMMIALGLVLVVILDAILEWVTGFNILTNERIIVIGLMCLLFIIPFFSKIKIGDIFEISKDRDV